MKPTGGARGRRSCASSSSTISWRPSRSSTASPEAAESPNHHPDILVHGWNRVRVTLSTHVLVTAASRDVPSTARPKPGSQWSASSAASPERARSVDLVDAGGHTAGPRLTSSHAPRGPCACRRALRRSRADRPREGAARHDYLRVPGCLLVQEAGRRPVPLGVAARAQAPLILGHRAIDPRCLRRTGPSLAPKRR